MKTCPTCNGKGNLYNPSHHDNYPCSSCAGTGKVSPAYIANPVKLMTPQEFLEKKEELRPKADVNAVNEALRIIDDHLRRGEPTVVFDGRGYTSIFGIDRDQRDLNIQQVISVLKSHGWKVETSSRQDGFTFSLHTHALRSPAITRSGNSG